LDHAETKAIQASKVFKEMLAYKAKQDQLGHKAIQVHKAIQAHKEIKGPREMLAHREIKDHKVNKA
jgi:hypothetical protein